MTDTTHDAIQRRFAALPRGLQEHIRRAVEVARELARAHGLDPERAALATQAHDLARVVPARELLAQAKELGIPVHPVERAVPVLLHGPVAATLLRREDGVADEELLQAVRWHSTACAGLRLLGKVVYLADKLDPEKADRYPYLQELRALALRDLDAAMLRFLGEELAGLVQRGSLLHPASVEAWNDLLLRR